jgi:transglutaminase-like putative cysteine protease
MNPRVRVTFFAGLASLLGSMSLLPIFDSFGWIPRVLLVVTAVTATSAIAHRIRGLAFAAPVLMVAVLTGVLTLLYAHQVAPLGFVPGPGALRMLHETLSDGFSDTTQLAAPVPVTRGLSLLTTGGIGVVAVLVETMATGLRRPAVAGLPLLAIFTVPAAVLDNGVGWQPFVFAAAGYLALLLAEGRDRITRWGRPVRTQRFNRTDAPPLVPPARRPADGSRPPASARAGGGVVTGQLTSLGRRVGAAAIGVAVVVPVVIPGLHSGWFGTHHTNGAGGLGGSGGTTINPIVSVRRDLQQTTPQPLFTYTTTSSPDYLRMLTLDKFDGTQWTPAATTSGQDVDAGDALPPPGNVTVKPTDTVTTDIDVSGLKEPFLPTPVVPTKLKAHGDWRYNPNTMVLYSDHSSTVHLKYQVTSTVYEPSQDFLNAVVNDPGDAAIKPYLTVPSGLPAAIKAQADNVVAQAHAVTSYQIAVALQNWFQSNFFYDTSVQGSNANALVSFLNDKRGYCEQFAATMALMARMEGIPSRVDVGFTPGSKIPGTETYLVTTADAHAWPELYFTGAGWLRFEPTPRADGQTTRPPYGNATGAAATTNPNNVPVPTNNAGGLPNGVPTPHEGGAAAAPAGAGSSGGLGANFGHLPIGWLVVLLLIVLAALSPLGARWWLSRRRWADADTAAARAHAAWEELGDDLRDIGLEWRGSTDSPRRAAAAVLATRRLHYDQTAQQALSRLARAEELARYAGPASVRADDREIGAVDLRRDQRAIRRALFDSVPRTRRLRARLMPPSTGRFFAGVSADVADAVRGWFGGLGRRAAVAAGRRDR